MTKLDWAKAKQRTKRQLIELAAIDLPVERPNIGAKHAGNCPICGKDWPVGAHIVNHNGNWTHGPCAARRQYNISDSMRARRERLRSAAN